MKSENKLILTSNSTNTICFHMNANEALRLFVSKSQKFSLGDIIIGRVQTVKKDLKASFVELDKDTIAFLPDDEINPKCLLNRSFDGKLKQGDEICVMISKEPVKTKPFSVSMNLNIQGLYSVIHNENETVSISNKLSTIERSDLKGYFERALNNRKYGTIIRTNAINADKKVIQEEILSNMAILDNVVSIMKTRTLYSKIYTAPPSYINEIRSLREDDYSEIITDSIDTYERLLSYFPNDKFRIRLYEDKELSMSALYNLERAIKDATEKKVFLKSGGYLIIEPTEALTVIDVNSGKIKKNNKTESIHITNLEAAKEISRQLILRNLSGMIIVDFINYENKDIELRESLIKVFKTYLKEDIIKTNFIDITGLGLIEITRQKKYASIYEML